MSDEKDVLGMLEAKFASLPPGSVLVPPPSDDSDVKDVDVTDPKWTTLGIDGPDAEVIERFIDNYPYTEFKYFCRKLKLTPAEALARVVRVAGDGDFRCFEAVSGLEYLKTEAQGLIDKGWEPGTPPAQPMSKAEIFTLLKHVLKVKVDIDGPWTLYDMAYRMGLDSREMAKFIVDYTVSCVLATFKYMGGGRNWLLSPDEIQETAAHCEWTRTGTDSIYTQIEEKQKELRQRWEEQEPAEKRALRQRWYQDYFPTKAEVKEFQEEQKKWKWPSVPYVDYCPACGTFFTATEKSCTACGALRMYEPFENDATLEDL